MSEQTRLVIVRSHTGKIHAAYRGTVNAMPCNSRNRGFRVARVSADSAKAASAECYCSKCFGGKPDDATIDAMCQATQVRSA